MNSRRRFISNGILTIIGLNLSSSLLAKTVSPVSRFFNNRILSTLTTAAKLRREGVYRYISDYTDPRNPPRINSELLEAINLYHEVINEDKFEIRAFNGIRKIKNLTNEDPIEVLDLYFRQYQIDTRNPNFKEAIAKEYLRLAIGNTRYARTIEDPKVMLDQARTLFKDLSNEYPNNIHYHNQYLKTDYLISLDFPTTDARESRELKTLKKDNRIKYKSRFQHLRTSEIKVKLDNLLVKPQNSQRNKQIKSVYKIYIEKLVENREEGAVFTLLNDLYNFDTSDSNTLFLIRKYAHKFSNYKWLEQIAIRNNQEKRTFWSKLALFDVYLKRHIIDNEADVREMYNILTDIERTELNFVNYFEFISRRIKFGIYVDGYTDVKGDIMNLASRLRGTSSAHWIDKFNRLCIDFYAKNNSLQDQVTVINLALKDNYLEIADPLMQSIKSVNKYRETNKPVHNQRLSRLRDRLMG
jgi:hypothetical protein